MKQKKFGPLGATAATYSNSYLKDGIKAKLRGRIKV